MENKEFDFQNDFSTDKPKTFWKNFGIVCLSVFLAALTVIVINL